MKRNIEEYVDEHGHSPFGAWFDQLNAPAAAKVTTAIARMSEGNLSNMKPVGSAISEYRIDFGPGYRLYLGQDGDRLILLLIGGTKKRQQADIDKAKALWADYKRRKKTGEI